MRRSSQNAITEARGDKGHYWWANGLRSRLILRGHSFAFSLPLSLALLTASDHLQSDGRVLRDSGKQILPHCGNSLLLLIDPCGMQDEARDHAPK